MLSLSTWLYHYCQIGAAVMVAATSVAIWRTKVLPVWMVAVGAAVVVLTLLHTWISLVSALSSLVWIGVVSLLLLFGQARSSALDDVAGRRMVGPS